jgi:hypothetical protein
MCRELVSTCSGLDFGGGELDDNLSYIKGLLRECRDVGKRGIDDPTNEDQCFVFYDGCIDECQYYATFGYLFAPQDGAASDAGVDAGGVTSDAGEGVADEVDVDASTGADAAE